MVVARMSDRAIGLISTLILVRLLVPADFGLVAMATSIIAMLTLFSAFSFDLALIQNPKAERRHYDTVWTFRLISSMAYALALVILAQPAAAFYNEPRLAVVIQVLAIGMVIGGFSNVGVVLFRKDMQFDKEFKFIFSKRILTFAVTIILALQWRNYWALVGGTLAGIVAGVLLSYAWQSYRPTFSIAARGELVHFSKWLFLNNTVDFFNNKLADFVIGRMAGPHALGLYNISYEVSSLPTSELAAPVNRAVFPGYAKMAANISILRKEFLNVLAMIMLLVLPAGAGIMATANLLVPVVLGPNWTDAVIVIQVLAIYGICAGVQTNTGIMFIALGRPDLLTKLAGGRSAVLFPTLIWGTLQYGVFGAAVAVASSALLFLPMNYYVLMGRIDLRLSDVISVVWRPAIASALMAVLVKVLEIQLDGISEPISPLAQLIVLVAAGAASYFVALFGLWRFVNCPFGAERYIWDRARNWLKLSV